MHKKFIFLLLIILSSCISKYEDKLILKRVSYNNIENWQQDNHFKALEAFTKSCKAINKKNEDAEFIVSSIKVKYKKLIKICAKSKNIDSKNAKNFFEENFVPYAVFNKKMQNLGLFTGYYEATLYGSFDRNSSYQNPVYKKPDNLIPNNPYFSRKEIEIAGILEDKGLELMWLNDPVNVFFLHIQGSGLVELPEGEKIRIGYDGKNNHPYSSLGKYMIDNNLLPPEKVNATAIKNWIYNNPSLENEIMAVNESYIFFRKVNAAGPIGAQNVELTAGRSLAIDNKFIAYGLPVWLNVEINGNEQYPGYLMQRLLIAQDTGGVIKGPIRGDIFFGNGVEAETYAAYQNKRGFYYIFLPK